MSTLEELNTAESAVEVTHSPAKLSSVLAVVAALLAILTSGLVSLLALLFGFVGLIGVASGLFVLESRRAVMIGGGIIFVSVFASGLLGNTPLFLMVSAIATILTFDLGQNAFSVGAQMSAETRTQRGELVHAASSLIVGSIAAVVSYGIYLVAASGQPIGALVFVLLTALVLIWAIRT